MTNPVLQKVLRDEYIAELKEDRLIDAIIMLKELEDSSSILKLKKHYNYKIESEKDYQDMVEEIKNEYHSGVMDPSREVAMIE